MTVASTRRVPLLHPADVVLRLGDQRPLVTFGLRRSVVVAVPIRWPAPHRHRCAWSPAKASC
jgi:hypothetical protein